MTFNIITLSLTILKVILKNDNLFNDIRHNITLRSMTFNIITLCVMTHYNNTQHNDGMMTMYIITVA
jgi:hypothetical protein